MAARPVNRFGAVLAVFVSVLTGPGVAQPARLGIVDVTLAVELSCPSCAAGLERRLGRLDDVASVEIDAQQNQVVVTPVPNGSLDLAAVREVVRNAGFEPSGMTLRAIGRVTIVRNATTLALAGESAIILAPGDGDDALVTEAVGQVIRVAGQVAVSSGDDTLVLHVETFDIL